MIEKTCKCCGKRLSEFQKSGMLGCPNCYKYFEREIDTYCLKIHGKNYHVGKDVKETQADNKLIKAYKDLIAEKERAQIEERFTDMAVLSEQIFDITEELRKRGLM